MSYIYHGETDWIKQPNRVVQTFRSGLCLIQQDYIRRADDSIDYFSFREGDAISPEDASPCIDGAYIFPAPSYQDMGNGFIKCIVSSYGRVNLEGSSVLGVQLVTLSASYTHTYTPAATEQNPNPTPVNFAWTIRETWLADTYTVTRTMLVDEPNSSISITPPALSKVLKKREISGNRPGTSIPGYITVPGYSSIGADWESQLASIDRRNFGNFDEVIITYALSGTVSASAPV